MRTFVFILVCLLGNGEVCQADTATHDWTLVKLSPGVDLLGIYYGSFSADLSGQIYAAEQDCPEVLSDIEGYKHLGFAFPRFGLIAAYDSQTHTVHLYTTGYRLSELGTLSDSRVRQTWQRTGTRRLTASQIEEALGVIRETLHGVTHVCP